MIKRCLLIVFFLMYSISGQSQILKKFDSLTVKQIIDTLFIDRDLKNWSVRVFTNYKVKRFRLGEGNNRLDYIPNNRYGIGFGLATKKLLIDIAFNIKSSNKDATDRFDMQGTTIIGKNHYVNFYLQTYKGFNVKNNFDEPSVFRNDIKSTTVGINYLYTLAPIEFSYSLLKAGLAKKNENIYITGGFGAFVVYDYFSANGSILPESTAPAYIEKYSGRAIGILGGFLSVFMLPKNFVVTFNLMPGIALINKKVTIEGGSYRPSNPWLYKVDFSAALGYKFKRFYTSIIYGSGIYSTRFNDDSKYTFSLTKAKFAIGYKIKVEKKPKLPNN